MQDIAETIVRQSVEDEQKERGRRTAEEFARNVGERVEEKLARIRELAGVQAQELVGAAIAAEQSYAGRMKRLVGPHAIDRTEDDGNAGVTEKGAGGQVVLSTDAADYAVEDREYWERVRAHEQIHQEDQATTFDRETIEYADGSGEEREVTVVGDLTEGHANEANETGDLPPAYREHRRKFLVLAKEIDGGEGRVKEALASGRMAELQEEIFGSPEEDTVLVA